MNEYFPSYEMRVLRNFLPEGEGNVLKWPERIYVAVLCLPAASRLELIVSLTRNCSRSWYILYTQYLVTNVYTCNFLQERPSWEAVSRSGCERNSPLLIRTESALGCLCLQSWKRWGMLQLWPILRYDGLCLEIGISGNQTWNEPKT